MIKRLVHALVVTITVAVATSATAQPTDEDVLRDKRVAEARAMMQAGRDEIIEAEMALNAAEAERFWPLYESYRDEVMVVRHRYAAMIGGYLRAYEAGDVSDQYAEELLDDWLDYRADLLKVRKQHVGKFKKILPIRKVTRFYQLENKMDVEIDAELAAFIPLIEDN
jgi:hypothetical protein